MATMQAKSKILPLTSVRFFAAVYVMLFHTMPQLLSAHHIERSVFGRFIKLGYVAVPFFFLLSGFILSIVYLRNSATIDKHRFYLARFARIYPLYLSAILLDLPHFFHTQIYVIHRSIVHTVSAVLAGGSLVQAWVPNLQGLNQPSWSLSAEASFYLLFPFIGATLWRMRGALMWPLALLTYAGGTTLVWFIFHTNVSLPHQSSSPIEHLYTFVLGICLAKFYVWIRADEPRSQVLQRHTPWLLFVSFAVFLAIPIFDLQIPEILMQHGVLIPIFAVILLTLGSGNMVVSTLFSRDWLIVLGEASFALYLIHSPVYSIMRRPIEYFGIPAFLVYVAITIGLSVASSYWLETPARRWIMGQRQARSFVAEGTSVPA